MLRCAGGLKSQVIDVNGWSFVKGNEAYYGTFLPSFTRNFLTSFYVDHAADILSGICLRRLTASPERPLAIESTPESSTWILKANVTVLRHADRTPKQKLKFNFPIDEPWTQPFVRLLNDETEEIILREREQLVQIASAIEEAKSHGAVGEDLNKLTQLNKALASKIEFPGTKAQLKPVYSKKQPGSRVRHLTKLTLVFKWGGEVSRSSPDKRLRTRTDSYRQFTHSARHQSRDLGENFGKDISIMSKEVLKNVKV